MNKDTLINNIIENAKVTMDNIKQDTPNWAKSGGKISVSKNHKGILTAHPYSEGDLKNNENLNIDKNGSILELNYTFKDYAEFLDKNSNIPNTPFIDNNIDFLMEQITQEINDYFNKK